MASRGLGRKGAAAQAAARAAAVVAKASIARGGDANRSDCLIEVADVEQVLPGSDEAWAAKVKVMLQQVFRRYGPVLDVRVPTGEANPIVGIRFANAKAAEAAMVAASQGFLAIHDAEVRLCQPLSREVIWRTFPSARRRRGEPPTEPKKKKLRPNERFAPPRLPAEMVDETTASAPPTVPAPAPAPPPKEPEVPLQHIPPDPPRPAPFEAGPAASEEDLKVEAGEAKVAKEMAGLLEQPFSKQKKALKAIRLQWHPDK
ncbi:Nucleosome assembly protein, partial [Durusdinium trenchii]